MSELLKGLDSIDWKSLNAPLVPKWLRDITSDNREIRGKAFENLDRYVVDIGRTSHEDYGPIEELVRTEVPCMIVPFLLELLEASEIRGKGGIIELLYDLARKVQLDIDKLNESQRERAIILYQSVQAGLPLYRHFYNNPTEPFDSLVAKDILVAFGELESGEGKE